MTSPARVIQMRRERRHLKADEYCSRCDEAAVVDPDGVTTESCIHHHEDDARALLRNLEAVSTELQQLADTAGHLMDDALLDRISSFVGDRKLEVVR